MRIVDVKVTVVELSGPETVLEIVPVPDPHRLRYTHRRKVTGTSSHELFLRVLTDEGVEGVCTAGTPGMPRERLELLKAQVLGADPLRREELYQRLHRGTRWVYQTPGWFGNFDNCLWDIAGKVAGLPVCRLLGQVRDAIPAYHTGDDGEGTAETYLRLFERMRAEWGITAYKFHNYRGARYHIELFRRLRREDPDVTLMNDPVCSYSLREAIEVGRVMEELGFRWLEEPFYEQELTQYQQLCAELKTMPVMATEMLMHDVSLCAQWLISGATDLIRVNARHGATGVVKLAHLAELHGTNVEMNAGGGLGGHVHVQLQCALPNTEAFEHFTGHAARAKESGVANALDVAAGQLRPSPLPGWGAELDWPYIKRHTVAEY
jgi:L-alanine-DL-glutamate epimerase-like enolase superfamily enzyme